MPSQVINAGAVHFLVAVATIRPAAMVVGLDNNDIGASSRVVRGCHDGSLSVAPLGRGAFAAAARAVGARFEGARRWFAATGVVFPL